MNLTERLMIGAGALGAALTVQSAAATYTLPQPKMENGVAYVSGGIGEDEAKAMKVEAKHYALSMIFSANKGNEYLADVEVTIKDSAGKELLSTVSDGPIMLLDLPAGRYIVEAEAEGQKLNRTVQVRDDGEARIYLHWPSI